ncbi:MAG: MFS transporter [Actinomycetota bacterium]
MRDAVSDPSPVSGDLRSILWIQALRAFLYGFATVLLGTTFAAAGLSDAEAGAVFTAMLAGMALSSIAVARWGHLAGRRRLYASLLLLMGAAGSVFVFTLWLPVLVLVSLTGTLSTDPNESGPITSLEQAMLGETAPATRTRIFGRYNAIAYLAGSLGALTAGGPAALRNAIPALPSNRAFFLAFPLIGAICALLVRRLSAAVEGRRGGRRSDSGASERSDASGKEGRGAPPRPTAGTTGTIRRLAALFALDSFGGGFIVQTFIVFWFRRKFGASVETMSLVFFAAGLLQAASSIVATWLAARIGLLNVMVFTHLPSNLLLLAVPLVPSIGVAITLLLARFALSQMDVPTRQAYVVSMVDSGQRTAAAAYTNTARYVARPFGPAIGGVLMQHVALAAPWIAAGGLKIAYDGALFALFRRVPIPGDGPEPPGSSGVTG